MAVKITKKPGIKPQCVYSFCAAAGLTIHHAQRQSKALPRVPRLGYHGHHYVPTALPRHSSFLRGFEYETGAASPIALG